MFCRNCGAEMNENQAICLNCGVEKNAGNSYCPNCGKEVAEKAVVCLNCGISVKKEEAKPEPEKYLNGQNKTTIALVCFFLGGLGIHNFMMGESKRGLMKILFSFLCGLSGLLAFIDFIKILMGTYVVKVD